MSKAKLLSVISILVSTMLLIVAVFYVYGMGRERRLVYSHLDQYHPVIYSLFAGKIRRQQNVETVIADYAPSKISRHDNYVTLLYSTDDDTLPPCCIGNSGYIHVISMQNRVVKAFAVEGDLYEIQYVFFNDFDEAMEKDYSASRWRHITARR